MICLELHLLFFQEWTVLGWVCLLIQQMSLEDTFPKSVSTLESLQHIAFKFQVITCLAAFWWFTLWQLNIAMECYAKWMKMATWIRRFTHETKWFSIALFHYQEVNPSITPSYPIKYRYSLPLSQHVVGISPNFRQKWMAHHHLSTMLLTGSHGGRRRFSKEGHKERPSWIMGYHGMPWDTNMFEFWGEYTMIQ